MLPTVVGTYGAGFAPAAPEGPSDDEATDAAAAAGTPPAITCTIYRQDNGAQVQTIPGALNVPVVGQWTATVNLGALPAAVYFIVAVITQNGQSASATVINITKT
jgi:hypothetical protein